MTIPAAQRKGLGLSFEVREVIPGLRTATGRTRSRNYDVTVLRGGKRILVEVKNWLSYPPDPRALAEAFDQFQRDVVFIATQRAGDFSSLRWVASGLSEAGRAALSNSFVQRVQHSPPVLKALLNSGLRPEDVFRLLQSEASRGLFLTSLR